MYILFGWLKYLKYIIKIDMANFGLIRDIATKNNMTLRDLASKIGMSEGGLQKILSKGTTNTTTLEEISLVLKVHPGTFFNSEFDYHDFGMIKQNGQNNQVGNVNVIMEQQSNEIEQLKQSIEHLNQLLEEKERLIQVLMTKK